MWVLIWDNASWHISKEVRTWISSHNRRVKGGGSGVRIISCLLPKQSPWLNPIEPKWVHGKRKVVEPEGLITAYMSWPNESAGSLIVRITSTCPFPKMLPDRALEGVRLLKNPLGGRFRSRSGTKHTGFGAFRARFVVVISSTPTFSTR